MKALALPILVLALAAFATPTLAQYCPFGSQSTKVPQENPADTST